MCSSRAREPAGSARGRCGLRACAVGRALARRFRRGDRPAAGIGSVSRPNASPVERVLSWCKPVEVGGTRHLSAVPPDQPAGRGGSLLSGPERGTGAERRGPPPPPGARNRGVMWPGAARLVSRGVRLCPFLTVGRPCRPLCLRRGNAFGATPASPWSPFGRAFGTGCRPWRCEANFSREQMVLQYVPGIRVIRFG